METVKPWLATRWRDCSTMHPIWRESLEKPGNYFLYGPSLSSLDEPHPSAVKSCWLLQGLWCSGAGTALPGLSLWASVGCSGPEKCFCYGDVMWFCHEDQDNLQSFSFKTPRQHREIICSGKKFWSMRLPVWMHSNAFVSIALDQTFLWMSPPCNFGTCGNKLFYTSTWTVSQFPPL